jgi:hypothetical protein
MLNIDFYYALHVEYNRIYHCDDSCNTICRCSTIENTYVNNVDILSIIEKIYNYYFENSESTKRDIKISKLIGNIDPSINLYTIDRICRIYKIWESNNWFIKIGSGYYGEEIDGVFLVNQSIIDEVKKGLFIDNINNRVKYLLKLEYGHLLPDLINKDYRVKLINKKDILFGNEEYYKKIDIKDYYNGDYLGIRCVVIKKGDKYKLIDGYNRLVSTKKEKVLAIVGY